ncbi:MAG: hypothetical protein AB2989_06055 [Candidatus Symbiodolus clandestinus]
MSSKAVLKTSERPVYSRPSFQQAMTLNSLQAQRVMVRAFEKVSRALYFIDVIIHIIGTEEQAEAIEGMVLGRVENLQQEFAKEEQRLDKLLEDHGIDLLPSYDHPVEYQLKISCPQLARFAAILKQLDTLNGKVDSLWLHLVLDNKQCLQAKRQLSQQVIKLGNRIIGIEGYARASIKNLGKQPEVEQQVDAEMVSLPTEQIDVVETDRLAV